MPGWETWQEIDACFFGILEDGVREAMRAGQLARQPVAPLAHLLAGAIMQAAMVLARAEDVTTARRELDPLVQTADRRPPRAVE